jgi:hypothetical protein
MQRTRSGAGSSLGDIHGLCGPARWILMLGGYEISDNAGTGSIPIDYCAFGQVQLTAIA